MSKIKNPIIEKIILKNLDELIGDKFGNYSKYIIQERALPDLRDGLKPVQRRVLYAMHDLRLSHKSAYKKSARVVGDVIGKYHPHGDTSVYDAMVRLGQEWKVNMPLVDMHGNKGSIDGDGPAAMRYTEARLSKISSELLTNIDKNLTKFSPNFDDSELEPTVLPARYPNLLVNGASGIASGYATNIPPHNLNELIQALIYIFKNKSVTLSNLTNFIKGPDFPTGGTVSSLDLIKEAYRNGKGKIVITSKWEFNLKNKAIEITEIPFEINKSDLVKKIDDLVRNNRVPGIKEVRDDTDRTGMQISLLCKPEANHELIMNFLFKSTDLRKNYNFNMVSIKDKKPQLLGLLDMMISFTEFQIEIYTKLYKFELKKLEKRLEIVKGLIRMISIIDELIKIIRNSKNKKEAKENIIKNFNFTENQAEAIVILRLYRLTSTDINELKNEKSLLEKTSSHFNKGIKNRNYLVENIIKELEEKYQSEKKDLVIKNQKANTEKLQQQNIILVLVISIVL
ncbi:MAG: DNA topoisomerase 4 subunit A, partial [Mycoplasmataceae bacterium]|nr:DNA topoisomerase 4 subunit A [Mycoplasmataceae bacterium]